jgi:hypothetical protein
MIVSPAASVIGILIGAMRIWVLSLLAIYALGSCACTRKERDAAERKVGKAAHGIAIESEKVIEKAASEVEHATKEAHEGWKEAEHQNKAKAKN